MTYEKKPFILIIGVVFLWTVLVFRGEYARLQLDRQVKPVIKDNTQQSRQVFNSVTKPTTTTTKEASSADSQKIIINSYDAIMGKSSARVTFVEFGDFQCPSCKRFWREILPQLRKDYVDTGKVKFVFKHFTILGKESIDAANATLCAKEQNKFWEYHDYLYNHQNSENQGDFSTENLNNFARILSLQPAQFHECLNVQKYNSQVESDTALARKQGFTGTPTSVINDIVVNGVQPYEAFRTIIDQQLIKQFYL